MGKLVIVGAGHVGSTSALLLAMRGDFEEIVLVDKRAARARAEADDMMAALPRLGCGAVVRGGDYADCADAGVVVVCAAAPARLGQTRNDMLAKNAQILSEVAGEVEASGFSGLYLVVSNPVDLLVRFLRESCGIARERVVGTGTLLDSMRLEDCLSARYGGRASALALGEHGEGLVVDWERTTACGGPVPACDREGLRRRAIDAAYEIQKGKGSTSYGIAQAVATVVEAWARRDGASLPLSVCLEGEYGIERGALAVPAAFGPDGVPRACDLGLSGAVVERLREVAIGMDEAYVAALPAEPGR